MKQKTLGQIFALAVMGIAFSISAYVLYYVFVGDVANFNVYVLWFGGGFILLTLPLFMSLSEYCKKEDEEVKNE